MKHQYPEIQGQIINIEDFKITRAKSIALIVLHNKGYYLDPIFIRKDNGEEIILVTLDIEIPQKSKNGILEREDIAIVCHPEDNAFPEVYALRNDFTLGLSHTNLRRNEYPVSLCVTEQNFEEVKHSFNPFVFIESIRQWLSLSSQNKLHAVDQPLEPFFVPKGFIIIPNQKNIDFDEFFVQQISKQSPLYKIQKEDNNEGAFFCTKLDADAQVSGYIRKEPQIIKDLGEFIVVKGEDFVIFFTKILNLYNQKLLHEKKYHNKRIAICCIIPVKRGKEDEKPEKIEVIFFATKKTIREIYVENEIWSETPDKQNVVSLLTKSFSKSIIESIPIDTYISIPDFDRISANLYNNIKSNKNKYTLIGAGALGSQVLELFARIGFGKWNLIDYDNLSPHNLARHVLGRNSIGLNKAEELSKELNLLLGEEFSNPINSDFIKNFTNEKIINELKESDAIIDISTSIGVERILARDYRELIPVRRITAFLNPKGSDLVVLGEDKKRKCRLDFLEMEYYRFIYRNQFLHDHLSNTNELKVRYASNSCRNISSKINQSDISLLSSICTKAVKKIIEGNGPLISIWRINQEDFSVKNYSVTPSKWGKSDIDGWKIYLNDELINEMFSFRRIKLPKETGGILLGSIDMERKVIYVFDTILAPEDSIESHDSFERGVDGIIEKYNQYQKVTDFQVQYLGEWHSHPSGCSTNPSSLDMKLLSYLSAKMKKHGNPALMCIVGDNRYNIIFQSNY